MYFSTYSIIVVPHDIAHFPGLYTCSIAFVYYTVELFHLAKCIGRKPGKTTWSLFLRKVTVNASVYPLRFRSVILLLRQLTTI